MSKYSTLFYRLYHFLATIPSMIRWRSRDPLSNEEKDVIAQKLAVGYYIILTGNKTHLSSVIVSLLSWIKTGKWAKYSHALMNCDNITDPNNREGFKFVEATAKGTNYATFDTVFECEYACLLTPANVSNEEWTNIIDALTKEIGTPYDDLFDLSDSTHRSCVEVVLDALKTANYAYEFKELDNMIKSTGNLLPQMFRDCTDFIVAVEK